MKETCLVCYGTGKIKCEVCGGSGEMPGGSLLDQECLKCKGKGSVNCRRCEGTGKVEVAPEERVEIEPPF